MTGLQPRTTLWLHPKRRPERVEVSRFKHYPHFFESFEFYGIALPPIVEVVWQPLRQYLEVFDTQEEEAPEFILDVARMIKRGVDVPPLLVFSPRAPLSARAAYGSSGIFDGRHRAWAAWGLGLRKAPVVDITEYWLDRTL